MAKPSTRWRIVAVLKARAPTAVYQLLAKYPLHCAPVLFEDYLIGFGREVTATVPQYGAGCTHGRALYQPSSSSWMMLSRCCPPKASRETLFFPFRCCSRPYSVTVYDMGSPATRQIQECVFTPRSSLIGLCIIQFVLTASANP